MKISYLVPGNKSPITEEYTFFSGITVVANIIPVLSKFSFYVENVFNNRSIDDNLVLSTYFNVVDSTEGGILNDNSPRPWVINNGGTQSYDNYKDYYYLPDEDRAIHRSVGRYVDRKHRKAARASTAICVKTGFSSLFLPVTANTASQSPKQSTTHLHSLSSVIPIMTGQHIWRLNLWPNPANRFSSAFCVTP